MPGKPQSPHARIEFAFESALAQYNETLGDAFPITPKLEVVTDSSFWALAEIVGDTFVIRVSTGTISATAELWGSAFADQEFCAGLSDAVDVRAEDLTHTSVVWLFLHEMHHFQMGHFAIVGRSFLSETLGGHQFALGQRSSTSQPNPCFPASPVSLEVEQCLEMQVDHDSIEMLLNTYSLDAWLPLRIRTCAIAGMMMLIEREDAKYAEVPSSHPKAATRIFQLFGHLIDMPTIQATLVQQHSASDAASFLPTDEEQSAFVANVVIPLFFDAVSLARIAVAQSIGDDLGNAADFFHDVKVAKLADTDASAQFVTVGAKQWADLLDLNQHLLAGLDGQRK